MRMSMEEMASSSRLKSHPSYFSSMRSPSFQPSAGMMLYDGKSMPPCASMASAASRAALNSSLSRPVVSKRITPGLESLDEELSNSTVIGP